MLLKLAMDSFRKFFVISTTFSIITQEKISNLNYMKNINNMVK